MTNFPQGVKGNRYDTEAVEATNRGFVMMGSDGSNYYDVAVNSSGQLVVATELAVSLSASSSEMGGDNVQIVGFNGTNNQSIMVDTNGYLIMSNTSTISIDTVGSITSTVDVNITNASLPVVFSASTVGHDYASTQVAAGASTVTINSFNPAVDVNVTYLKVTSDGEANYAIVNGTSTIYEGYLRPADPVDEVSFNAGEGLRLTTSDTIYCIITNEEEAQGASGIINVANTFRYVNA